MRASRTLRANWTDRAHHYASRSLRALTSRCSHCANGALIPNWSWSTSDTSYTLRACGTSRAGTRRPRRPHRTNGTGCAIRASCSDRPRWAGITRQTWRANRTRSTWRASRARVTREANRAGGTFRASCSSRARCTRCACVTHGAHRTSGTPSASGTRCTGSTSIARCTC